MHVQQRGGGELPAFLGAQRGVSETPHVVERRIMKEKDAIYAKEDFTDEDGIRARALEG